MKPLAWDLVQLLRRNRDGSRATQYARKKIVMQFAQNVQASGARNKRLSNLKQQDFARAIQGWKKENLSDATLRNRVTALRWVAEKIGKPDLVAKDNQTLGLRPRSGTASQSKARVLVDHTLGRVTHDHVRHSLQLQAAFGLRRAEAMKIQPAWADRGDKLVLKASWTKGGRPREIPIRTPEQRVILNAARVFAGNGSLIPPMKSYREHVNTWERETKQAGLSKTHGLRHAYAQNRYLDLTGRKPPVLGGTRTRDLAPDLRPEDRRVRLQIAQELGHSRIDITNAYLGR
ncbi:MAG: integrase domain-containing protein [Gammaproteobacteria bacterium]|nr:integrase domain-containing protein [Gammaproteobacteria bacterium]